MHMTYDSLLRSLPEAPEIIAKLRNGTYEIHGGVIRHAAGSGQGGQIVKHLIFPSDPLQTQQRLQEFQSTISNRMSTLQSGMDGIQQSMNVLQGLQKANLVMSGLNLAVTTVGFVIVCKKLDGISGQIQAQSEGIAQTLKLVGEVYDRSLLHDEARFRSLLLSTEQYCEQGDVEHLKAQIPKFHDEYQFTKLILERNAPLKASNLDRFSEISLLQDRLVNLSIVLTHVQVKCGSPAYGRKSLTQLADDVRMLNAKRIESMLTDDVATEVNRSRFAEISDFLKSGRDMIPALAYQADVIDLESRHPGLIQRASESNEILLVAA